MPREGATRGARYRRRFAPQQCHYQGHCSRERAYKKNGERHGLCEEHRDHQNALQREHYRRATKQEAKKQKTTKHKAKKMKRKTTSANSSGMENEDPATTSAPVTTSAPATTSARATKAASPRADPEESYDLPKASITYPANAVGILDTSQGTSTSVGQEPSPRMCQTSTVMQSPIVYILVLSLPLQLGITPQLCAVGHQPSLVTTPVVVSAGNHGDSGSAAPPVQQFVLPVSQAQNIVAPTHQTFVVAPSPAQPGA